MMAAGWWRFSRRTAAACSPVPVERILVEDGRVTGVGLRDGRHFSAPVVVSNADYRRTVLDLVGAEHFPRRLVAKTREATMGLPFATLYVATDTPLPERPNANLWWYADDDIDAYYERLAAGDIDPVPFLFMSFASQKDPKSATVCPPGHSNFQLMTLCPPEYERWGVTGGPAEAPATAATRTTGSTRNGSPRPCSRPPRRCSDRSATAWCTWRIDE